MTQSTNDFTQIIEAVHSNDDVDIVRRAVEFVWQALIDAEAADAIGAGRYERTDSRANHRNGTRHRTLSTKGGDVELKVPKLRQGSFFPSVLERRRRIDRALFAVVAEAYVHGVSTRKVDDLAVALGMDSGISKSEVSRICTELDRDLAAFRNRSLGHIEFPYIFLDATYVKCRTGGHVVSKAVVIATGVSRNGDREVLGIDVGDSEDGAFWTAFLRSLRARGLSGPKLVISDCHSGLRQAIDAVMIGSAWQRCRVHFMRNVLAKVPKESVDMVAATIRTMFSQPDADHANAQLDEVVTMLDRQFPDVAAMVVNSREDLLAFSHFPQAHWKQIWSTNPLERLNKEIKRRTNVVGIFPNDAAVSRLCTAVVVETHDEWQVADKRYMSEHSMAKIYETDTSEHKELTTTTVDT